MAELKLPRYHHAGFTLIELTIVIILLGIVGMFSSRFISSNVVLYQTVVNQNERLNDARFIFNRMNKEFSSAVAFSLKSNVIHTCIEFVPFTAAGQYLDNVSGQQSMSLIMDSETRAEPNSRANDFRGQYVSVLTTDADDFYSLSMATPPSTLARIENYIVRSLTQASLTFVPADRLSNDSPVSRYFIVKNKVQYCLRQVGDSMRLFRNEAALSAADYPSANRVLMAEDLSLDSRMTLTQANQFSHAILDLNFGFRLRDDSVIRFDHQLVMSNVP